MDNSKLFDEIIREVEFRTGMVIDFTKPSQISTLSEVMTDWGLGKVKTQFIRNLLEGPNDGDNAKSSKEVNKEDAQKDGYTSIGGAFYVKNADAESRPGTQSGFQAKSEDAQRYVLDKDSGKFKPTDNKETTGIEPKDVEKSKEGGGEPEEQDDAAEADAELQANISKTFSDSSYQNKIKKEADSIKEIPAEMEGTEDGLYAVGGGYYSRTENGPAEFKVVEESFDAKIRGSSKKVKVEPLPDTRNMVDTDMIKMDIEITDTQLHMTKKKAKQQSKESDTKNVGAGTATSRAGEAMIHQGLRFVQQGYSLDEIENKFNELVNSDDHILNSPEGKEWVISSISTIKKIDEVIGIDNIKNVSWDTKYGRSAIGVSEILTTSADMFVRTKEGKNIGISLKKTGIVFLNSGGWATQSEKILNSIKSNVPEDVYKNLADAMSITSYKTDLAQRIADTSTTISSEAIKKSLRKLMREPAVVRRKFLARKNSHKYLEILSNPEKLIRNIELNNSSYDKNHLSNNEVMAYTKLLQMYHKKEYKHIREVDNELTKRTFDTINQSESAKNGMKDYIVDSMHLMDTLGLNKNLKVGGVDEFLTFYGIEPDGAVLSEPTLITLLGKKFQTILNGVRDGSRKKKELKEIINKAIEIDYTSGIINFKHENNKTYPLFKMNARSKSIGAAPTMELSQTPFMAHALKQGTFDTTEWDKNSLERFKRDIVDSENEDFQKE